ncbi:MAG: hypothetical protein ACYC3S_17060 [Chloroflexota bacterium]
MDDATVTLIGLLVGLLGAGVGVAAVVGIPLGWYNRFLMVSPPRTTFAVSKDTLLAQILALNDDLRPWEYRLTPDDPRADLVAEWKVADARWWGAFSRNRFRRTYRAFVSLDPEKHELRMNEESATVTWTASAGGPAPSIAWEKQFFRGVVLFEHSREVAYGIKDVFPLKVGELYKYDFNPWQVKGPLLRLALENGWSYCPVVLRSQLGKKPAGAVPVSAPSQ